MKQEWPPIGNGLAALLCFSALYEPVRLVLLHGQSTMQVAGVGGVGGLVNLDNPGASCSHNVEGGYCYVKGAIGPFMAFACLTLVCWVGPLLVACAVQSAVGGKPPSNPADPSSAPLQSSTIFWIHPVWISLNLVWFLLPFFAFGLGLRDIEVGFARGVLTVALAAAHPLSWSLALVMIPVGGVIPRLMDRDSLDTSWFQFHRLVGYTAMFWALLHGFGELAYLFATKRIVHDLNVHDDGENLIYWAGILTLVIMLVHLAVVATRKWLKPAFYRIHRVLAALLLLSAASHWWPFALFFVPATSVEGVCLASQFWYAQPLITGSAQGDRRHFLMQLSSSQAATALLLSLMGSLSGLQVVWMCRENYMMSPKANLSLPFVFPPLSVAASISGSVLVSWVYFAFLTHQERMAVLANSPSDVSDNDPTRMQSEVPRDGFEISGVTTPLLSRSDHI